MSGGDKGEEVVVWAGHFDRFWVAERTGRGGEVNGRGWKGRAVELNGR